MSTSVEPPAQIPLDVADTDPYHYRLAVEEARAQADALRAAVGRANDLIRQLEEMVESLRAILLYPKAYDWPLAEPISGEAAERTLGTVVEVDDPGGPIDREA